MMSFQNIPAEMKRLSQWVGWKYRTARGKPTKVPINPHTGRSASCDDSKTWGNFETALAAMERLKLDGVGFVFSITDPYCGIDLDKCRDKDTGEIEPWALAILKRMDSYTEITPSGRGLHIIVRGKLPAGGRRKGRIEMYDKGRYFTFTGQRLRWKTN